MAFYMEICMRGSSAHDAALHPYAGSAGQTLCKKLLHIVVFPRRLPQKARNGALPPEKFQHLVFDIPAQSPAGKAEKGEDFAFHLYGPHKAQIGKSIGNSDRIQAHLWGRGSFPEAGGPYTARRWCGGLSAGKARKSGCM